jgi:acetyl esterase/lipase
VSPFVITLTSLLSMAALGAPAGGGDRPPAQPLWPGGAPGALGAEPADVPTLALYSAPPERASGAAVIVCPGGGYGGLADHEGDPIARWLNTLGITAAVLRYRLGPRYHHPVMLQDAQRAIRTVRARAAEWKVDPTRIGILGFSAGGHLASTAATHFEEGTASAADPIERVSSRPDVAILLYPVISMEPPVGHAGSRRNLLGDNPSPELVQLLSNQKQVTARTPPTFLFHTADDAGVPAENSLQFALALARAGVPYELHIYGHGRHGVGLATDDPVLSTWTGRCADWLRGRGFISR